MITIDEVIEYARKVAEKNKRYIEGKEFSLKSVLACKRVAEEHEQLAEWLEELKAFRSDDFTEDLLNTGFTKGYNKAIDEFAEALYNKSTFLKFIESDDYGMLHFEDVYDIAEQLKGGAE